MKGIMQMEEFKAEGSSSKNSLLGLLPVFLGFATHALSAGQGSLQSCHRGFSQAVLPPWKATCVPVHTSWKQMVLLFSMWSKNETDF